MVSSNDKIVMALIGAGGRGTQNILSIKKLFPEVEVKSVCEVDNERGGRVISELEKMQKVKPQRLTSIRAVLDDKDIDAVVICTPEHWHALATIWACQAGKDVYVEKNPSINIHEGRKMIEAAEKYKRVVQVGFQNRSGGYNMKARDYIQSGKLGKITLVKTYCMLPGSRPWNLKPDGPAPEGLDWDQWLGPAPSVPYTVSRHKAWYDWWAYSGGLHMASDASHVMDLARMALGDPENPKSVFCAGGRVLFDDKRDIPDNQTVTYDMGEFVLTCESSSYGEYLTKTGPDIRYNRNLYPVWQFNSTRIELYGTEGMMYLGRHGNGWQVFGANSKLITQEGGYFPDEEHQTNFIKCIKTRQTPNSNLEQAHRSATLVHMANISYRVGEKQLYYDSSGERFTNSDEANVLARGTSRPGYEIPEVV